MSNTDSFIEEVSEEVRKDQLYGYLRKYGWIAALLIIAIVGGAAYFEWSKTKARNLAQSRGDALVAALEKDAAVDRAAALGALSKDAGPASALIEIQRAAVLAEDGDKAGAVAALQAVASEINTSSLYRELANLKLVMLNGSEMDPAARDKILDELTVAGAAFRPLALEQRALAMAADGDTEGAIAEFIALLDEPQVSAGMRARVSETIQALGGEVPPQTRLIESAEAEQ